MEKRYNKEDLSTRLKWDELDTDYLHQIIGLAKIEDLAGAGLQRPSQLGDVTTALMPEGVMVAQTRRTRANGGLRIRTRDARASGLRRSCLFEAAVDDGAPVKAGEILGQLKGPASALLQAERVFLNFLQHLLAWQPKHVPTPMPSVLAKLSYSIPEKHYRATESCKSMHSPPAAGQTIVSAYSTESCLRTTIWKSPGRRVAVDW